MNSHLLLKGRGGERENLEQAEREVQNTESTVVARRLEDGWKALTPRLRQWK